MHMHMLCCVCSGLLVGQLDRSSFYERCGSSVDLRVHLLPLEGLQLRRSLLFSFVNCG